MYSTCLFCLGPLGANDVLESFPVGRRLAFDAEKGRLWVVCRRCERWNLTPLEERWEAVEDCERRFRAARLRVSSDNVGFARLREGLELVRVGHPLRPELAAWRYGDQFGRRRRRSLIKIGVGLSAVAAATVAGSVFLGAGLGSVWAVFNAARTVVKGSPDGIVAKIPNGAGEAPLAIRRGDLDLAAFIRDRRTQDWSLWVKHATGHAVLTGDAARRGTAMLLPAINRFGASRGDVRAAVRRLEDHGEAGAYLDHTVRQALARRRDRFGSYGPLRLLANERLAVEMALHEDSERRAMEGELATLEAAWRDAEQIAAIADNMFLPAGTTDFLTRHRRRPESPGKQ